MEIMGSGACVPCRDFRGHGLRGDPASLLEHPRRHVGRADRQLQPLPKGWPELAVCNNALRTAMQAGAPCELRLDSVSWGHAVESAVGAQLMASTRRSGVELLYWNVGCKEVDYVLRREGNCRQGRRGQGRQP